MIVVMLMLVLVVVVIDMMVMLLVLILTFSAMSISSSCHKMSMTKLPGRTPPGKIYCFSIHFPLLAPRTERGRQFVVELVTVSRKESLNN